MNIEVGTKFKYRGVTHVVCNIFIDGKEEVVTYRYWSKSKRRHFYDTDFKELFLIGFEVGLYKLDA